MPADHPSQNSAPYVPIACGIHDRLESWAVRRTPVNVVWTDADGETRCQQTMIADVVARDGADWVVLADGVAVRADHLVTVGGVEVAPGC